MTASKQLGHFYIGEDSRQTLGLGFLPWDERFEALKEINDNQLIVMEPFLTLGGEVGREVNVYRNIMPDADSDEEASKSCAFIKENVEKHLK